MSTLTQQHPPLTTTVERRFYARIAPQTPLFVAIKENEPQTSLLMNISENGLLVSTPAALKCNYVTRLSIPLNGLPEPVQVTIRVAWVSEATNAAGIQLLDLSEHDRQQIRKWGARESARSSQPESEYLPEPVPFFPISSPTPQPGPTFGRDEAPSSIRSSIATRALSVNARARLASLISSRTMRVALGAAVGLAVTVLLIKASTINPFASSRESPGENASAPPSNTVQPAPENPDSPQIAPVAPDAPPLPALSNANANANAHVKSSPAPAYVDRSVQQTERATAAPSPSRLASVTPHASPQKQSADSPTESSPFLAPTETPSLSVPPGENAPAFTTPQAAAAAPPTPTDALPESNNAPAAPLAASPSFPVQPLPSQPLPNRKPLTDVPAAPSTSPTTSMHSAPTLPPAMQPSIQPVIQMGTPQTHTLEVHLPSGYEAPFFTLPGERVLDTPAVTIHIQRSVHISPARGWPFNHNKKVVVGELISRVDPQPPPSAVKSATSSTSVLVKATVSKDGRIENAIQILGPPSLASAAVEALREWRYQPTLVDNKPVETLCYVTFQFHAPSHRTAKR